jgi:hypothetical protein
MVKKIETHFDALGVCRSDSSTIHEVKAALVFTLENQASLESRQRTTENRILELDGRLRSTNTEAATLRNALRELCQRLSGPLHARNLFQVIFGHEDLGKTVRQFETEKN